jgi:RNA-directed DNA polymerase
VERFKRRLREIVRRAKSVSIETTMDELAPFVRGRRGDFGFCETPEVLVNLMRWVRMRLRVALWRPWKTPRRRRRAARMAKSTAVTGYGPGRLIRSRGPSAGLSNAYFRSLGLRPPADHVCQD